MMLNHIVIWSTVDAVWVTKIKNFRIRVDSLSLGLEPYFDTENQNMGPSEIPD